MKTWKVWLGGVSLIAALVVLWWAMSPYREDGDPVEVNGNTITVHIARIPARGEVILEGSQYDGKSLRFAAPAREGMEAQAYVFWVVESHHGEMTSPLHQPVFVPRMATLPFEGPKKGKFVRVIITRQ